MKNLYFLVIPVALFFLVSCVKSSSPTPVTVPTGTFSGQLVLIHLSSKTGKLDTTKTNVVLTMSTTTGYAVTSDTTTVQAGSNGPFLLDNKYIQFQDKTAAGATAQFVGTSKKIHLNGTYTYAYDGTSFNFYAASSDTLGFNYALKKN
ncbi:MAG: hypothetical protein ACXVAY_16730 [Mucilaginibacter sp.]